MSRRPGTASSSAAAKRKPTTLDTYIQAAISANVPTSDLTPKLSRRRRKKQQKATVAKVDSAVGPPPIAAKAKRRKRKSRCKSGHLQQEASQSAKFRVRGLVTIEELEDDDEAEEVQQEIRDEFSRFGELLHVAIVRYGGENGAVIGDVVVKFRDEKDAVAAFAAFDGKIFGGKTAICVWGLQNGDKKVVIVDGMLTREELEDPDEAADVEEEMMQFFGKYGRVSELLFESTGQITVIFGDECDAQKVVQEMNESHYGGRPVFARLDVPTDDTEAESAKREVDAETKRVSTFIEQTMEEAELQILVSTFLKRLASLQERAHTQNPRHDKRLRRLVLGMHEVRRGLLANKIRLLVIATDMDGCDAVAEKYAELVAVAREKEVPVVSPMNRRKLGRVLQKSVRVSCVGVYSVEGANDLFQQILQTLKTTIFR